MSRSIDRRREKIKAKIAQAKKTGNQFLNLPDGADKIAHKIAERLIRQTLIRADTADFPMDEFVVGRPSLHNIYDNMFEICGHFSSTDLNNNHQSYVYSCTVRYKGKDPNNEAKWVKMGYFISGYDQFTQMSAIKPDLKPSLSDNIAIGGCSGCWAIGCGIPALILVIGIVVSIFSSDDHSKKHMPDEIEAYVMACEMIKDQLKTPKTADFPGFTDRQVNVVRANDTAFTVFGYVDSQNSFGAMIRTEYIAYMIYAGNDLWILKSLDFLE